MKHSLLFALLASLGLAGQAYAQAAPSFSGVALAPATGLAFPLTYLTQESATLTATLKNTYLGSDWTISSVTSSDAQYVVTAETCTAKPVTRSGGSCSISVKYAPSTVSSASTAKINVTRTSAGGNFWVPLSGSADVLPKVPSLPPATAFSGVSQTPGQGLAFAELTPGQSSPEQLITYKNTYLGADWTITAISSSDSSQFEVVSETCTAKPVLRNGGTCSVYVRFKPISAGTVTGRLNVTRTSAGGNFYTNLAGIGKGIAPVLPTSTNGALLTPSSLTFADTEVGNLAAEQTFTIKNTFAAASWKINAITSNTAAYRVLANDCSTLAPGASCTVTLVFSPTTAQPLNGVITINRTVGTTTSNLSVTATGKGLATPTPDISAGLRAEPGILVFPGTLIGTMSQRYTLTLTNIGSKTLPLSPVTVTNNDEFSVSSSCTSSLAAGASCPAYVSFKPKAMGGRTGTLTLTYGDNAVAKVQLGGNGLSSSNIYAEPGFLTFALLPVGDRSSGQTVVFFNGGSQSIGIKPLALTGDGAHFDLASTCGSTLGSGASCQATVSFVPKAAGDKQATLLMTTADTGESVQAISITGVATQGVPLLSPVALTFPTTNVGSVSNSQTVTLKNTGNGALTVASATLTQPDFKKTTTCTTVPVGGTCTFTLQFAPKAAGAKSDTLTVTTTAGLTASVRLSGAGSALGYLNSDSAAIAFGDVFYNTNSAPHKLTLTNVGSAPLTLGTLTLPRDVSAINTCSGTLAVNASCTLSLTFKPSVLGPLADTLRYAYGTGTLQVPVTGNGTGSPSFYTMPTYTNYTKVTRPRTGGLASGDVIYLLGTQLNGITRLGMSPLANCAAPMDFAFSIVNDTTIQASVPYWNFGEEYRVWCIIKPGLNAGKWVQLSTVQIPVGTRYNDLGY